MGDEFVGLLLIIRKCMVQTAKYPTVVFGVASSSKAAIKREIVSSHNGDDEQPCFFGMLPYGLVYTSTYLPEVRKSLLTPSSF
jgi:hypothetical protein